MTPTSKLRFVEKVVPAPEYGEGIGKTVRVLQQWYVPIGGDKTSGHYKGEWRDIPLETEK